ncbi:hypothetical protein [Azospira sp. I13]|uniref:hypothetical protein n=1 Tax=Azospira sp. I13 TaxID=1765050 RepID=UPI00105821AB|nr:hypothetical protein [Azospira sp. I13]
MPTSAPAISLPEQMQSYEKAVNRTLVSIPPSDLEKSSPSHSSELQTQQVFREELSSFDTSNFRHVITAALTKGNVRFVNREVSSSTTNYGSVSVSQRLLAVATACMDLGRVKQVKGWLRRIAEEGEPEVVFPAISIAVRAKQPELTLRLYQKLSVSHLPRQDVLLRVTTETIELAKRLRKPHARHGAWKLHQQIVEAASDVLGAALKQSTESNCEDWERQALLLLAHAKKLINSKPGKPAAPSPQ